MLDNSALDVVGRGMATPYKYSEKIADTICERMANGETIAAICRDPEMPSASSVLRWRDANPAFDARCARARELLAQHNEQQMVDVCDAVQSGEMPSDVARVVLSNLQWRAAKSAPKLYGDKITSEITGANGGAIQLQEISINLVAPCKISQ